MFVQKNGTILFSDQPVKGVDYLTTEEALLFLREKEVGAIIDSKGTTLAKSMYAIDAKEAEAINSQVIRYGENAGKTKGEVEPLKEDQLLGFVNLHTSDNLDGNGDKKWYAFNGAKIRHEGDTIMTKQAAIDAGIEIG